MLAAVSITPGSMNPTSRATTIDTAMPVTTIPVSRVSRHRLIRRGQTGAHRERRGGTRNPERWDDVVVAFGRRGADHGWCWCQRLLEPRDVDDPTNNREVLRTDITTAVVPPGVLAYVDGVPVGWSRIMPRADVPGVHRNRALRRILVDQPDAWWIVCFAVDQRHRGVGVAAALLKAAVDHARAHGATVIEGHPVDTDAL